MQTLGPQEDRGELALMNGAGGLNIYFTIPTGESGGDRNTFSC